MAVKVHWRAANGSARDTEHEEADSASISNGHLSVRKSQSSGYSQEVAGYAAGVWVEYVISQQQD